MPVAVIYHENFGKEGFVVLKDRVIPSFMCLRELINQGRLEVFTPQDDSQSTRLVQMIHNPRHLDEVEESGYYEVALLSLAGVVMAAEMIGRGEYKTAFAYVGAAGHHASPYGFWGFCYLNDVAAAICRMRELGLSKFLILDVDPHTGDGTRNFFRDDPEVIHINFDTHSGNHFDLQRNNYDFGLGLCRDEEFLEAIQQALRPEYEFDIMFVVFGHDSHTYDYGGFNLTYAAYPQMARMIKDYAAERPLLWVLSGGSNVEVASQVIPDVLGVLSE